MFYSTGNNFGAGQIRFKSYQAENYLVLNANFTIATSSLAYQGATVLEIYVPALRIDRSVEVGVFVGIRDRRQSYGSGRYYDGCTLARSWIKDSNTICIEKLGCFAGYSKLYVYIAALYPQLNQGLSAQKQTPFALSLTPVGVCCGVGNKSTAVVFEHWVFLFLKCGSAPRGYDKYPWEGVIEGFPQDVQAVFPMADGQNQYNPQFTGLSEGRIKGGHFASPYRCESGSNPYSFAFLVRGDNEGEEMDLFPMASEADRCRWIFERERQSARTLAANVAIEVGQGLEIASLMGWLECSGGGYTAFFTVTELQRCIPGGRTGFGARTRAGNGLAIYDIFCDVDRGTNYASVAMNCIPSTDEVLDLFDTGVFTYNQY